MATKRVLSTLMFWLTRESASAASSYQPGLRENKLATCVGECSAPWENLVEGISVVGRWHASGHRGWAAADAGRCALLQPLP